MAALAEDEHYERQTHLEAKMRSGLIKVKRSEHDGAISEGFHFGCSPAQTEAAGKRMAIGINLGSFGRDLARPGETLVPTLPSPPRLFIGHIFR